MKTFLDKTEKEFDEQFCQSLKYQIGMYGVKKFIRQAQINAYELGKKVNQNDKHTIKYLKKELNELE